MRVSVFVRQGAFSSLPIRFVFYFILFITAQIVCSFITTFVLSISLQWCLLCSIHSLLSVITTTANPGGRKSRLLSKGTMKLKYYNVYEGKTVLFFTTRTWKKKDVTVYSPFCVDFLFFYFSKIKFFFFVKPFFSCKTAFFVSLFFWTQSLYDFDLHNKHQKKRLHLPHEFLLFRVKYSYQSLDLKRFFFNYYCEWTISTLF